MLRLMKFEQVAGDDADAEGEQLRNRRARSGTPAAWADRPERDDRYASRHRAADPPATRRRSSDGHPDADRAADADREELAHGWPLNSISRRSSPIWMLFSATATKVNASAWMIGSSCRSPRKIAIGMASRMVPTVISAPATTATQNAVSSWRRVRLGRWTTARQGPDRRAAGRKRRKRGERDEPEIDLGQQPGKKDEDDQPQELAAPGVEQRPLSPRATRPCIGAGLGPRDRTAAIVRSRHAPIRRPSIHARRVYRRGRLGPDRGT